MKTREDLQRHCEWFDGRINNRDLADIPDEYLLDLLDAHYVLINTLRSFYDREISQVPFIPVATHKVIEPDDDAVQPKQRKYHPLYD